MKGPYNALVFFPGNVGPIRHDVYTEEEYNEINGLLFNAQARVDDAERHASRMANQKGRWQQAYRDLQNSERSLFAETEQLQASVKELQTLRNELHKVQQLLHKTVPVLAYVGVLEHYVDYDHTWKVREEVHAYCNSHGMPVGPANGSFSQ
jgi:hypothetical protein